MGHQCSARWNPKMRHSTCEIEVRQRPAKLTFHNEKASIRQAPHKATTTIQWIIFANADRAAGPRIMADGCESTAAEQTWASAAARRQCRMQACFCFQACFCLQACFCFYPLCLCSSASARSGSRMPSLRKKETVASSQTTRLPVYNARSYTCLFLHHLRKRRGGRLSTAKASG